MLKTVVLSCTLFVVALSKWTFTPVDPVKPEFNGVYSEAFARRNVLLCYSSYQPFHEIEAWDCSYCKDLPEFQLNDMHISNDGVLLAYSGYDPVYDQIVFAFRGTVNIDNWFTDADFLEVEYPGVAGGRVHEGFYFGWNSLKAYVLGCVNKLIKAHPHSSLLVTGHSLGAGIAHVASLDIFKEAMSAGFVGKRKVMTFGSPRWSNPQLAEYFHSVVDENWRVVNKHDKIVPLPPTWVGYKHTTTEVWYTSIDPLEYTVCDSANGEDPDCYYAFVDLSWKDHTTYLNIKLNCSGCAE